MRNWILDTEILSDCYYRGVRCGNYMYIGWNSCKTVMYNKKNRKFYSICLLLIHMYFEDSTKLQKLKLPAFSEKKNSSCVSWETVWVEKRIKNANNYECREKLKIDMTDLKMEFEFFLFAVHGCEEKYRKLKTKALNKWFFLFYFNFEYLTADLNSQQLEYQVSCKLELFYIFWPLHWNCL